MTIFKPNLKVEHLSVFGSGKTVFSADFHSGLNIIRGENSSGKSTIMDFLFYALGGDFLETQWRESALRCDSVTIGVRINGQQLALSRDIDPKSSRPMRIFLGGWQEALASAGEGWEIYPYRRGEKDSFSQVLFRFLGLPEVQYDNQTTKVTMNQVLRLLYSDQLSPVDKIFRSQTFDDALTRQSVGDLLCGAYSDKYYKAKIRRREAEAEFTDVSKKQATLIRTHGRSGHPLTLEWLGQEQAGLERRLDELNSEIEKLEAQIFDAQFDDRLTLNDQDATLGRVVSFQEEIARLTVQLRDIEFEIVDSNDFIAALGRKIEQLTESGAVVEQFSNLKFDLCPACLSPIRENEVEGACALCKNAYDHDLTKRRSMRLLNDYQRQLDQSQELQSDRHRQAAEWRAEVERLRVLWEQASQLYRVAVRTPTTEMRLKLRDLNRRAGYAYKELEELAFKREVVEELAELTRQAEALNIEIATLDAVIRSENARTKEQLSKARRSIELVTLDFLKSDLERQTTFSKANRFDFEFDGDRMSVNGESFFSASSMVYMRNSFFAAFLFAAANDPSFAHPRFLLMDTIEDKGMEQERSQNFQRVLAKRSKSAVSEHQIIIATSMIAPDLDSQEYTVGETYTHENRTLKLA
ncbi:MULTISPECIES: hypothetical protein [unclassified Mesorhizobium]|uniref:hypothetical protein n=3 Tax=Mesorhizobium TaxID=68287 RepID=UPI000FE5A3E7|nr:MULTISPECIES: hypothetical protein [unclassified Mesorhizobium]TGT60470.1 hypothetical protein EN813_022515 [Mesorhizobium sp. M00.F.Ca.ET.170.01.1.1]RWB69083.1 MAG: hypothetical protein EOQ49_20820 [Mesorhizobium sp.]RWB91865.1 MAG: hypothetical protein EOQ52_05860 [Mesorhizobium sp.]RWE19562.1 MAG: hypothetical protein EOS41_30235 [Mesorhizobium sp.]TGS69141.1 hypothetical protein EN844_09740 [Mesorhizobium sp. M3A.F.Ca.ET.201.01.1.1]